MEILANLYQELRSSQGNTLLAVLEDIEFYLHKFDNAIYFTDLGGVKLLTRMLNDTLDEKILSSVAITIGSAIQRYI